MNQKICRGCGESFPATLEFFCREPKGRDGLKSRCKTCLYTHKNLHRKEQPEKEREYKRTYYRKNRERLKDRWRKWERANPEKAKAVALDYEKRSKGKKRAKDARRRTSAMNCFPSWANPQAIEAIYQQACILIQETGILHVVDHIIPLKHKYVCGLHIESNLRVVTELDNQPFQREQTYYCFFLRALWASKSRSVETWRCLLSTIRGSRFFFGLLFVLRKRLRLT